MKLANAVSVVVATSAAGAIAMGGTAWAVSGGYGPSVPTGPTGTPGGYSNVVTTETVATGGGSVSADVPGGSLQIVVPNGAFSTPVQLEVTAPTLSQLTGSVLSAVGFSGFHSLGGFGVKALDANGRPMTGRFAKPITVTVHIPGLSQRDEVLRLDGPSSASVVPSTISGGDVSIQLDRDPNLVVVAPTSNAATSIPGATTQQTGLPLRGELFAGIGLVAAGAVALLSLRRKSRVS